MDQGRVESFSLREYLNLALRRKWVILLAVILVPAAALAFSLRQPAEYQASAEVLLNNQNLLGSGGGGGGSGSSQADRIANTQAALARAPIVVTKTLAAAGVKNGTVKGFLKRSSVKPAQNSDVLTCTVRDHRAATALALATEYCRQYVAYRKSLDTAALQRAKAEVQSRINALVAQGDRASATYTSLVDKEQQLETQELLQAGNAALIRPATDSTKVQPQPVKDGLIGLGLGIFLGFGLALLWETLDTRVRTAEGIADRLKLPLLGRIPEPPRRLRGENHLVMLEDPAGTHAEAFRVLRTNLEFANLERGARSILVTSAVPGEGKSTTAANLAIALAYAGRSVILVNLDLRRPHRGAIFRGDDPGGLTDVALGRLSLDQALQRVRLDDLGAESLTPAHDLISLEQGTLDVLNTGPLPPNPGDFLLTNTLAEILNDVADRADIALVDAPPLLTVGDALILSSKVDAFLIVSRLNIARRPMLNELRRVLNGAPATLLGFVLTGAQAEEGSYYDYARRYEHVSNRAQRPSEEVL